MPKKKGKTMKQTNQAMAAESNNASEHVAYTQPTIHKDAHEPNNRSV